MAVQRLPGPFRAGLRKWEVKNAVSRSINNAMGLILVLAALFAAVLLAPAPVAADIGNCLNCHSVSPEAFGVSPMEEKTRCATCHISRSSHDTLISDAGHDCLHCHGDEALLTSSWFDRSTSPIPNASDAHNRHRTGYTCGRSGCHFIQGDYTASYWYQNTCARCHHDAGCQACHDVNPETHGEHGSSQLEPVIRETTNGTSLPTAETFYCGSSSCHGLMPSISRPDCLSCHNVGK